MLINVSFEFLMTVNSSPPQKELSWCEPDAGTHSSLQRSQPDSQHSVAWSFQSVWDNDAQSSSQWGVDVSLCMMVTDEQSHLKEASNFELFDFVIFYTATIFTLHFTPSQIDQSFLKNSHFPVTFVTWMETDHSEKPHVTWTQHAVCSGPQWMFCRSLMDLLVPGLNVAAAGCSCCMLSPLVASLYSGDQHVAACC